MQRAKARVYRGMKPLYRRGLGMSLSSLIAADKQATDVVLLDTRKACSFADYFIICSGDSDRQLEAIHRAIIEALKTESDVQYHSEGTAASGWMLLDLGNIVVHIFSTAERDFYQLESLWSAAPVIVKMI